MAGPVVVVAPEGRFGKSVVAALAKQGRAPVVLMDNPSAVIELHPGAGRALRFNGLTTGPWVEAFEGASVVINLAGLVPGADGDAREHAQRRIMGARIVGEAVDSVRLRPKRLVTVSSLRSILEGPHASPAVALDEDTPVSHHPSVRALRQLELSALGVRSLGVRALVLRLGAVLDDEEGLLPAYRRRFEGHLGGPVLPRMGLWPWIHRDDAVAMLLFAAFAEGTRELEGPLHAVAPHPVTSAQLAAEFGRRLHRLSWLPMPRRLAARRLGEESVALLTRGPPVHSRAGPLGFVFRHPEIESALDALIGKPHLRQRRESLEARES